MVKLNDHYFIAWLKVVKHYNFSIINNKIYVKMSSNEYTKALEEYNDIYKPILKEIRITVKLLNNLTSQ